MTTYTTMRRWLGSGSSSIFRARMQEVLNRPQECFRPTCCSCTKQRRRTKCSPIASHGKDQQNTAKRKNRMRLHSPKPSTRVQSEVQAAVVERGSSKPQPTESLEERSKASNGSAMDSSESLVFAPEDFRLEPGQPSHIDRSTPIHPDDVYRCPQCVEEDCQDAESCPHIAWRHSSAGYIREILNAKVYDVAIESPLELASQLSAKYKNSIYLKREDSQQVFSFKLRGAYNKMASLSAEQRAKGVVASSAGNHAQGVALAAKQLGCKATICMPVVAPEIKIKAVQRLGGIVELTGETYTETQTAAQDKSQREGLAFIAPYDDPYVVAGQGTIGAEILRQLSSVEKDNLEAVFIAIGGGGLAAGIAIYIKSLLPHVKIFGVEPAGANCMTISLNKGRRVTLSKVDAFADGVAVKTVGRETFRLCRELLDGVLLVDNQSISGAIKAVFNDKRSILEPAGAVAVAGATQYLERHNIEGRTVVAVTSGANMNFDRLRLVADLAAVGAKQEAIFVTTIPEKLGSFQHFIDVALADTNIQITEFKYRYSAQEKAHILWGANVRNRQEAEDLVSRLNAQALHTQDASGIEAVQVHLRHLVGGRARSYMGSLPNEKILQVDFPERPGALRDFLSVIVPRWNLTLFHYRLSGNRQTPLLLGIQIPPGTETAFQDVQKALGEDFTFSDLPDSAKDIFEKFIS